MKASNESVADAFRQRLPPALATARIKPLSQHLGFLLQDIHNVEKRENPLAKNKNPTATSTWLFQSPDHPRQHVGPTDVGSRHERNGNITGRLRLPDSEEEKRSAMSKLTREGSVT